MNKLIHLFILLPYLSSSQINITSTNLPNIWDTVIVSGDNGNFSVGVLEINSKKTLIKIVDVLGREEKEVQNGPLFYIYNNGTVEKKIILE